MPPQVVQKVPKAQAYQFFVKDDNSVILVSSSDWRVADVIKKKSSDYFIVLLKALVWHLDPMIAWRRYDQVRLYRDCRPDRLDGVGGR